jgi:histidinol-phosphate aminotransferase
MLKARNCIFREVPPYRTPSEPFAVELHLDMNENTSGCSPRVLARLQRISAKTIALYPDRERAEKLVAQFLGRQASQLLLTNGADEAIDLLCRAYIEPGDEVILIIPAFPMYEIFALAAGAKIVKIPASDDFSFPLSAVLDAVSPRTRLIVITNPNNPTGAVVAEMDIMKVLKRAADAAVLVDEAYYEFYGATMMSAVGIVPNLFVARTFSKAYGLAGMRLGILAGSTQHISIMRRIVSPFNINVFAVQCLPEALRDQEFVQNYVAQVRATREWFRTEVQSLGFKVWPSQANFVLVSLGEQKDSILRRMREWGIALRDREDCPGCVRISIGTQKEMEVVLQALKQTQILDAQRQREEQPAP